MNRTREPRTREPRTDEPVNLCRGEPRPADTETRAPMNTDEKAAVAARLRAVKKLNFWINVTIAVASLGTSIALGTILPLPVYKVIIGGAVIVAAFSLGKSALNYFAKPKTSAVEEDTDGR